MAHACQPSGFRQRLENTLFALSRVQVCQLPQTIQATIERNRLLDCQRRVRSVLHALYGRLYETPLLNRALSAASPGLLSSGSTWRCAFCPGWKHWPNAVAFGLRGLLVHRLWLHIWATCQTDMADNAELLLGAMDADAADANPALLQKIRARKVADMLEAEDATAGLQSFVIFLVQGPVTVLIFEFWFDLSAEKN